MMKIAESEIDLTELSDLLERLNEIHATALRGTTEYNITTFIKGHADIPEMLLWLDTKIRDSKAGSL